MIRFKSNHNLTFILFSSRNAWPWVDEYGCHLSSKQSKLWVSWRETRHELAAMLEKNPHLSTQFPKRNPSRGWQGVTVGYRHAQRSIATYSAVLCCSVLHGQFCSKKMLLFIDSNDCNGMCWCLTPSLCFFSLRCQVMYWTLWFLMKWKNKSKCLFSKKVDFFNDRFFPFNVCIVNCTYFVC